MDLNESFTFFFFLKKKAMKSLRTVFCSAVWSSKMLANTGAVLSLLCGLQGCDPEFQDIWSWFRRYLAFRPEEMRRINEMVDRASVGSLGHGPVSY